MMGKFETRHPGGLQHTVARFHVRWHDRGARATNATLVHRDIASVTRRRRFLLRSFGLLVDTGLGQLAQGYVGVLLLVEGGFEELRTLAIAEFIGPSGERPVAGYLVVLDGLRR